MAPYLFLAPLLQMLFQVANNQFLIIKKTWPCSLVLVVGATLNIILNLYLIPIIGIEGASIATLIGYAVSVVVITIVLLKINLMVINKRLLLSILVFIIYICTWRVFFHNNLYTALVSLVSIIVIYLYFYKKEISLIVTKVKER